MALVAALSLVPFVARAHTTGVSQSELSIAASPTTDLHARFSFAADDVGRVVRTDSDGDGLESEIEVATAKRELAALLDDGVEVTTDSGARCEARSALAPSVDDGDGLTFEGTYVCPEDAERFTVTYFFLGKLPRGHRHVATFLAGNASTQRLMTPTSRAISIARAANGVGQAAARARTAQSRLVLALEIACLLLGLVVAALLLRRRVVTHTRVTSLLRKTRPPSSVAESPRDL
jgi:hypothetical protein